MCGIAGMVNKASTVDRKLLDEMTDTLTHRGPEERGVWVDKTGRVGFGQRRLAIIDLSSGGRQPRVTDSGDVAVTFNGEIYNYLDLRDELVKKGHKFSSQSDTEVLLNSYLEWGKDCVKHLNGMFAFAIWDGRNQEFFAARDHIGEKPFKYFADKERIIFGSEIKSILCDDSVPRRIDWDAVSLALSYRFVPSPLTGFLGISKLPAGHTLTWREGDIKIEKYWDATSREAAYENNDQVWDLFKDSVRRRMISDRPLGAFLSGGIDSTSVVAAMSEISSKPVETFAISIGERSEDLEYAKIASKRFGTSHHEIDLGTIDYPSALEKIAFNYDEPFFDQSALPSLLINEEIKKFVTVALSGDGGDELFGGYPDYIFAAWYKKYLSVPPLLRGLLEKAASFSPKRSYQMEIMNRDYVSGYAEHYSLWKSKLPKSRYYLTKEDILRGNLATDGVEVDYMKKWLNSALEDTVNAAAYADLNGRLPDGYLAKVDFASMASAVEVRAPFLDRRLVSLSQQIPGYKKISGNRTKIIWKEIIKGRIPDEILTRPKRGFAIPLHRIISQELKEIVQENLLASGSDLGKYLNVENLKRLVADHDGKKADYSNHIWSLLMLELWIKKYHVN